MIDRIVPVKKVAEYIGVSPQTLRRQIEKGNGPPLLQLSPRRQGVRESDLTKWLASIRRNDNEGAVV